MDVLIKGFDRFAGDELSQALTFEVSAGGTRYAASITCTGAAWIVQMFDLENNAFVADVSGAAYDSQGEALAAVVSIAQDLARYAEARIAA